MNEADVSGATCFVIGPIGDRLAEDDSPERAVWEEAVRVLEEVIEPACKKYGVVPIRADAISQPGEIPEQAFVLLRDADLVIADVTDGNPNVMYELGLRHTQRKCTIQIGEYGRLPFDISVIRTVLFKRTATGLIDARNELARAIEECLKGGFRPVSATRVWTEGLERGESEGQDEAPPDAEAHEEGPPGLLELWAEMEVSFPRMNDALSDVAEVGQQISSAFSESQAEIEASNARGGTAAARLTLATKLANRLQSPAARLERDADEYERLMAAVDAGVMSIIAQIDKDPEQLNELEDMPDQLEALAIAVRETMETSQELVNQLGELGGISRVLRAPARRISNAVRRIATVSSPVLVWQNQLRAVQDRAGIAEGPSPTALPD